MATDYNSKYSGEQVEALLDQVASGNAGGGGGGGIAVETDPIFSASPAATITEQKIAEWDSKSEQGEKGDKGDKGDTGVGVQSVTQTTTSSADGGSNVVTVTLTDGTKSTFTVKNGSKGSQGIQGIQGPKGDTGATGAQGPKGDKGDKGDTGANGTNGTNGKDGADGATFTPSVDSAGNLSWTNDKGLTNPPTVNIKGPKGDAGSGGGSGGSSEIETIYLISVGEPLVIDEMLAEKRYDIYLEESGEGAHTEVIFLGFEGRNAEDTVTIKHFYAVIVVGSNSSQPVEVTLSFPDDCAIFYPNGKVPEIADEGIYELSITQVTEYGGSYYNVVVTPFRSNYD